MDETENLKKAVADLQERLREESRSRADLEKRCHLLEKLAYRDPTTGLRSEMYLHARVREEIERSIRYPSATTLVTVCAPEEQVDMLPKLGMRLSSELRASDHVFSLRKSGLAILLVETPEEGARRVLERLTGDLEQFIGAYGYSVTSFPVDANLADEFLTMALQRHEALAEGFTKHESGSSATPTFH